MAAEFAPSLMQEQVAVRENNIESHSSGRLDTGSDEFSRWSDLRLPLAQERLIVGRRMVENVAARIGLRTQTEDVTVSEPLRSERVEVTRVPVDRIVATPPETRVEGDMTFIPVVEEVLVVQYCILEQLRIIRHAGFVDHTQAVTLRRQEAVIDDTDSVESSVDSEPDGLR